MKILLTGGVGFIGQWLAAQLSAQHELVAFDILLPQVHDDVAADRERFPGEVIVGDVAEPSDWAKVPQVDAIVHLAAETGVGQSMYEVDRYVRVNVEGTRLAAGQAQQQGVPLVSMSSRAVYGQGRYEYPDGTVEFGLPTRAGAVPGASHEDDPHRPVSVYGETKSAAEKVLTDDFAPHIPVTIVRPQNVIGPGQALKNPYTGVLAAFLARLREGRPVQVYGDGSATRDFQHVQDLAALLAWCVENPPAVGQPRVLNSGTGYRMNLTELAQAAIDGSPSGQAEIEYREVTRAGDIDHALADLSRGRELGVPESKWTSHDAVADFIRRSWNGTKVDSSIWDKALEELSERGLTS